MPPEAGRIEFFEENGKSNRTEIEAIKNQILSPRQKKKRKKIVIT